LKKVKVLIAGEQALIREGLCKILSRQETIEVAGEAENSNQALALAIKLNPDVVLIDIDIHGRKNIAAARTIKSRMPEVGIIVLTINDQEDYLYELIKAGISAYVLKDISPGFLVQTILGVARGESFIHSVMTSKMYSDFKRLSTLSQLNTNPHGLTRREFDVLRLVARGDNNRSIAQKLFISEKTVKNHLTNIFQKLGVDDRTQAAIHAVKNKMVDL
jgi:DNA-binding NarL/FixJ family response regulator